MPFPMSPSRGGERGRKVERLEDYVLQFPLRLVQACSLNRNILIPSIRLDK